MHPQRLAVALVLSASLATVASAAGGNLVTDGGFEAAGPVAAWITLRAGSAAVPGWRVTAGISALVGRYWSANGGANSLEVGSPGASAVAQTIATVAGRRYRLSFALAGNPDGPPRWKVLDVSAGTAAHRFTFDSAGRSRSAMGWTNETLDFTATAAATTIRFARPDGGGSAWWGPAIDDVTVVESGESPAAAAPAMTAAPAPVPPAATPAPLKTPSVKAFAPAGGDPYSGLWTAAYPGKPLRVYVERHGTSVVGHATDGNAAIPTGAVAFTGRIDGSPVVVLGKCADADARGWHGAVIEWTAQDAFHLHVANCHAGDVVYSRWRGQ